MKFKLIVLLILFTFTCVTHAQSVPPLVIHINGQLYRWSPGEDEPRFTGCDLQGDRLNLLDYSLIQSSQGDWTAFMALPPEDLRTAPQSTGNLWVCHIETGEAYPLSTMEPGMSFMVSEGAFSPDGSRIVWTEVFENFSNPSSARLMVHDLDTQTTGVLVESIPLVDYCGIGTGAPRVIWGEAGIVVGYKQTAQADPCSEIVEVGFSLYGADGTLLHSFPIDIDYFETFYWLADPEPRIAFVGRMSRSDTPHLYSLDMTTGELRSEDGALEAFRPGEDANGGHYVPINPNPFFTYALPHIEFPGGQDSLQVDTDVALSPDGTLMAIIIGHTLYFADAEGFSPAAWNETYYALAGDEGAIIPDFTDGQMEVAWAPPSYRLAPLPQSLCPETESLDLQESAYTSDGTEMHVAPSSEADMVKRIPEGQSVFVVDTYNANPFSAHDDQLSVCSGGVRWRQVIFEGQVGWTDELAYRSQG